MMKTPAVIPSPSFFRRITRLLTVAAPLLLPLAPVLAPVLITGCQRSHAAPSAQPVVPGGEVWLTAAQTKDAKIVTSPIDERVVDDVLVTSGKITFERVSHVYSPVTGRVTKVFAELGQQVKKGDPLATIDSPDIGLASADLGKAQADLLAAQHDYTRQKELFAAHATSERDLEKSEDEYRQAKAELERARQKASLFQTGGSVTQGYTLRAAMDGEVMARSITPGIEVVGQYVSGSAVELFTIGPLDRVWVLADIFESDLARVQVGAKATLAIVTYPDKKFEATVDYVADMLDPTTRTTRVRCVLDNPDRLLKPEMYATVKLSVDARSALAIPRSALLHLGDSTMVFVEVGPSPDGRTRYERRPVVIDDVDGSVWLPVSHGVEKGDRVVTTGGELLSGML